MGETYFACMRHSRSIEGIWLRNILEQLILHNNGGKKY
jgi:hypothetical protein